MSPFLNLLEVAVLRTPALVTLSIAILTACSSPRTTSIESLGPALVTAPLVLATATDRRAEFRETFCSLLIQDAEYGLTDCNAWLQRLPDEAVWDARGRVVLEQPAEKLELVFVSGLLAECFEKTASLFSDVIPRLAALGYHSSMIPVRGRASSEVNAAVIRDFFVDRSSGNPSRHYLLIGYSKGVVDSLQALVTYPEVASHVKAVISIAGTINGSPLADAWSSLYEGLLADFPFSSCPTIDRHELESLKPSIRLNWLAMNRLPDEVAYFSIVGVPSEDRISRALRHSYSLLSRIDPRNDGQVLFSDAVIPRSTMLAYVNADHWAVALPLQANAPWIARSLADQNRFPRTTMIEAALILIHDELRTKFQTSEDLSRGPP